MDNFYTRHLLELVLFNISDGYLRVIGTVRINNIKGFNKKYVLKAVYMLTLKEKGAWTIVIPAKTEEDKIILRRSPPAKKPKILPVLKSSNDVDKTKSKINAVNQFLHY